MSLRRRRRLKRIIFTTHAKERIILNSLTRDEVIDIVRNPLQVIPDNERDKMKCVGRIIVNNREAYIIVVYAEYINNIVVVTVIKTDMNGALRDGFRRI